MHRHGLVTEGVAIDLVVPTVGRTVELERFLGSVAAQTWQGSTRVILVDQNADDRLDSIVAAYSDRVALLRVRSEPGTSRACNVGFRHCTAEIVGRADDDCWYPPDLLARVAAAFREHPQWEALSGMSCDEAGRPTQLRWDRTAGVMTRWNVFRRAIAFTLFMRRSLLESLGDWDETYGPRPLSDGLIGGASEETEYLLRALAPGFTLGYEPSIRIFHADFAPAFRDRGAMRKAYTYGLDHARLLRQHGFPKPYGWWRAVQLGGVSAALLLRGEPGRARFYAAMARGRMRGMVTSRHTRARV
jgi:glycosyltransferase involved in cell wall biosynthesis